MSDAIGWLWVASLGAVVFREAMAYRTAGIYRHQRSVMVAIIRVIIAALVGIATVFVLALLLSAILVNILFGLVVAIHLLTNVVNGLFIKMAGDAELNERWLRAEIEKYERGGR